MNDHDLMYVAPDTIAQSDPNIAWFAVKGGARVPATRDSVIEATTVYT